MGLIRFTTGLSIGPTHPIDMVNRLLSYMYISPDRNMYCSTSNDFGNVEHRLYFNLLKTSCNGRRIITTISDAQARYLVSRILSNVY